MFKRLWNSFLKKKNVVSTSIADIFSHFTNSVYKNSYTYSDFLRLCSQTYNKNSTLNMCVNRYSNMLSDLPIKFCKLNKEGEKEDVDLSPEVMSLFQTANSEKSFKNIVNDLIIDYLLVGECFIYKHGEPYIESKLEYDVSNLKKIGSYYRVPPNVVRNVKLYKGSVVGYEVYSLFQNFADLGDYINDSSEYNYGENYSKFDTKFVNKMRTNSIIHFLNHNPVRPDRGLSKLVLLLNEVGILEGGKKWNRSILENSLVPSGIFYFPSSTIGANMPSKERVSTNQGQVEAIEEQIKYRHSGFDNVGKSLFLTSGLKFEPISQTAKDLEFIQGQLFCKEEISRCINLPLQLVNLEKNSSYNNYREARKIFLENNIPFYNKFLKFFSDQLIKPHYPEYIDLIVEVDKNKIDVFNEEIFDKFKQLENVNFLTYNEKRELCGLQKVSDENSDKIITTRGNILLEDLDLGQVEQVNYDEE